MSNNDEFHSYEKTHEVHDRYSEFGPSTAWLKGKFAYSKSKQKTTGAISGLFTTAAAVGIAIFLFTPFFNATVGSISPYSASVNVSASFGMSDYSFPLYYTLAEVADEDNGDGTNDTVIENDEIENLDVSSEEIEDGEGTSGVVESFNSELDFDNLKPGTTYLLQLRLEAADDGKKDLLCSLTFKTPLPYGGGSGQKGSGSQSQQTPGIPPAASTSPSPSESPSPSPSVSPSPSPSASPSPTAAPYYPPAPDVSPSSDPSPSPTVPPTEYISMSAIDAGSKGSAYFVDGASYGAFYVNTNISEFGENELTNVVYGSSSPISTSQGRLMLILDPGGTNRVVDLSDATIVPSFDGGLTGISVEGAVKTDAIKSEANTYQAVLEYLGSEGQIIRATSSPPVTFNVSLPPAPPPLQIYNTPEPILKLSGTTTVEATYTLNLDGMNISSLTGSYVKGTPHTGKLSAQFLDPNNGNATYAATIISTVPNMFDGYISTVEVTAVYDFQTIPPTVLDINIDLSYTYSYPFEGTTIDYPTYADMALTGMVVVTDEP